MSRECLDLRAYRDLNSRATATDEDGKHPDFVRVCMQYGAWAHGDVGMPHLKSFTGLKGDEPDQPRAYPRLRALSDTQAMIVDHALCLCRQKPELQHGYYLFELAFILRGRDPVLLQAKTELLHKAMKADGIFPSRLAKEQLLAQFIEKLRIEVVSITYSTVTEATIFSNRGLKCL